MKRRDLLRSSALLGAAVMAPPDWSRLLPAAAGVERGIRLQTRIIRLNLRHTWTTTMSSSDFRDTILVQLAADGVIGTGEGAPIVRYRESAQSAQTALESLREYLAAADPREFHSIMAEASRRIPGEYAAKAALNIALLDWLGKKLNIPLYRYFGLAAADTPLSTFSIGMDSLDGTRQKVREAEDFPILKIKVGLSTDEASIAAVRDVTRKPLRVDANEGWRDKDEAVRKINWLESQGVELVEQPMPAAMLEETRWVRSRVHIPIIADEACLHLPDIPRLAEAYDGVNIKVDKAGGLLSAQAMIQTARALNMKVMLGCMVSSSVAVTAAAHLSPLADYADLDGNLLIANDPFSGMVIRQGKIVLPQGPGLGLQPRT